MSIKQVIVIRKDLNMRKGKIAAQAAHASMKVFFDLFEFRNNFVEYGELNSGNEAYSNARRGYFLPDKKYFYEWITGNFKKICVSVNSEHELDDLYAKALEKHIHCSMIIDSGLTEFNNVPTKTCIAIGPWIDAELDEITGKLPLL
jgi:PTH2 family peptidyl-tRNA hydrolase